jgi:hypothetical protein
MMYVKLTVAYALLGVREALTALATGLMFVATSAKAGADKLRGRR